MTNFLALILACLAGSAAGAVVDRSQAPVNDAIVVTRATLNRLELGAPRTPAAGLLPEKKDRLPLSVQLYLKPSGQLNSGSPAIQKLAQTIRRQVAPGAKQKDRLRDSVALAEASWLRLNEVLPVDATVDPGTQASMDWRMAWPKAGEILASGKADADGRALVEVALLRALNVPARTAWAQGRLVTQYWVALAPPSTGSGQAVIAVKGKAKAKPKKKSAPTHPLGFWALLDPGLQDYDIEAWSLDNGVLQRALWVPAQELRVQRLAWHRRVYAESASATAKADLSLLGQSGRWLPEAASPTAALDPSGAGVFYVLTLESFRLECQGAMAPMEGLDLLTPYRPHLPKWGRELQPRVLELELEGQALWSDRPDRLRFDKTKAPGHEWQSPPPALGVLHYLSVGVRRPYSVLQAKREGALISGVLLRADNLTPRTDWVIELAPQGVSVAAQSLTLGAEAAFSLTLTAAEQLVPVLELRTQIDPGIRLRGDLQLLPLP